MPVFGWHDPDNLERPEWLQPHFAAEQLDRLAQLEFMRLDHAASSPIERGRRSINSPRVPCACATSCDSVERPRLFLARDALKAFRNCDVASFRERCPRPASSS